MARINKTLSEPIVLSLNGMTARRRKSLIEAHIPFVVADSQIYLPFMGVSLTERYSAEKPPSAKLMPSSQLLLFYFIYHDTLELYTNGLEKKLDLSAMQISRAVRQLKLLGLVDVKKDKVQTVMFCTKVRRDLYEAAKPYLINPVRKRIYVEYDVVPIGLPYSGVSALAERTILNSPMAKTFAFCGTLDKISGTDILVDSDEQAEIEIWRYSPTILSKDINIVDTLSLATSLLETIDERVEQAVDCLLTDLWGD